MVIKGCCEKIIGYFRKYDKLPYLLAFLVVTTIQIYVYHDTCIDAFSKVNYEKSLTEYYNQMALLYFLTYKYGFIGRALIGSVIYGFYFLVDNISFLLFQIHVDYISFGIIFRCLMIIYLNAVMCVIVYKLMQMLKLKIGIRRYYLLFLIGMISSLFFTGFEYRLNDYPLFMLQLFAIYLVLNQKEWLAFIPMVFMILIHEGSILLTCPVVFAMMVAVHLHDDSVSKRKTYLRMALMGFFLVLLSFYFLKLQAYVNPSDLADRICADMLEGLGRSIGQDAVNTARRYCSLVSQVVYSDGTTKWNSPVVCEYNYKLQFVSWLCTIVYFLTLLPIVILTVKRVHQSIRMSEGWFVKLEKVAVVSAGFLTVLPLIVFKEDIARWILFFWIYYCILAFYGLYIRNEMVLDILDSIRFKVVSWMKESKTNIAPILVYYISIIPMGGGPINVIYYHLYACIGYFTFNYCSVILDAVENWMMSIN